MLQLLRGKKSSLFVKIILGVIVIGFSFFGIESYFVGNTNTSVAKVGGSEISQQEFQEQFNRYVQRMVQMMGPSANASMFQNPEVKRRLLDQMIDDKVVLEASDRLGLAVPAKRIQEEILKIPAFQNDGKFDAEQYRQVLALNGMSPLSFEERLRQEIASRDLPAQVAATAVATDAEVDAYIRLRDQRRDFRYIKLDRPEAPSNTEVGDDEIEAFYKEHQADFMVPERVAIEYVELDAAKLAVEQQPDEAVLRERYEKNQARYTSAEQRLASHILVKVGGKGGPEEQKQALAKAEEIEKQLREGKDFATLAKQESADLGSRNQGGDLGWLDRGTTEEAFEGVLFSLAKGEISKPVLGSEGYHIIELRDIRPGKTRTFEEVRPELEKEYAATERERVYAENAGRLTDITYQDPSSLEPAAKELGLVVQKTALFPRTGGEGIAANPAVVAAAFSDGVLVQNNNSDPIDLGPNHVVVLRVAEHKAATPKPLDEVRAAVRARIIGERLQKEAKSHADSLFAELSSGKTLDAIADGRPVENQAGVGREAASVDTRLVAAVFQMPRPQEGKPSLKLVDLGYDTYALVQLTRVTDGSTTGLDAKTREAARNTLEQGIAAETSTDFVAALRKATKVRVSENRLADQAE